MVLYGWLPSLTTTFSGYIYNTATISIPFLFYCWSLYCLDPWHLIYALINWSTFGHFHFLVILNNSAIFKCKFWSQLMFSFLLDIYLKSKTAGSHDNSLQPWKSYKVGFQSGCTSYIPASSVVRLQFLFLLATTVLSFDNILPCEYEVSRLKSVVCNSPSIGSYAN